MSNLPVMVGIADVAKDLGLTHRAMRFYEARGLIKPDRVGTNRFYSATHIKKLQRIIQLTRYGFTLAEIKKGVTRRDLIVRHGDLLLEIQRMEQARADLAGEIEGGADE